MHFGCELSANNLCCLLQSAANVHDIAMTPELLTNQEETVHGGSGYLGAEKRENAIARNNQGKKSNTGSTSARLNCES